MRHKYTRNVLKSLLIMPSRAATTVAEYQKWVASQGGRARKKALTPEQRKAIARKAARARWRKAKKS